MSALKIGFNRKFQIMIFEGKLNSVAEFDNRFLGIVKITPVS